MPDFVYVLLRDNGYEGDAIIDIYCSMEKAVETADFKNREEGTMDYKVRQIRMVK